MQKYRFKQVEVDDLPRFNHFLKQHGEAKAGRGDRSFWLENNQTIIAAARLVNTELENVFWLRGVFVIESCRHQGVGSELIRAVHNTLNSSEQIFAFPLAHLETFYANLGYRHIHANALPVGLQARYSKADAQNKGWLCMAYGAE